jgi:hypothetical protein
VIDGFLTLHQRDPLFSSNTSLNVSLMGHDEITFMNALEC